MKCPNSSTYSSVNSVHAYAMSYGLVVTFAFYLNLEETELQEFFIVFCINVVTSEQFCPPLAFGNSDLLGNLS